MSHYKIEAATGQHIGDREEQQDRVALFAAPRAPGYMMAVLADGRGAGPGGSQAAEQVIRTARQVFDQFSPLTDDVDTMLASIAQEAHTMISLVRITSGERPQSTMVALVISAEGVAHWAHAGNSRLYRFSGPNPAFRTIDHSYREKLIADGNLAPDDHSGEKLSNLLINTLGAAGDKASVTLGRYDGLKAGDSFLLCSDGLTPYFSDAELGAAIGMRTPRETSEMLIAKTRERSAGRRADNCSLALVRLVAPPPEKKDYKVEGIRRAV
nr:protein phosphatase 2C domain-containing protein [uncultured Noviherbaspirillum sp.]